MDLLFLLAFLFFSAIDSLFGQKDRDEGTEKISSLCDDALRAASSGDIDTAVELLEQAKDEIRELYGAYGVPEVRRRIGEIESLKRKVIAVGRVRRLCRKAAEAFLLGKEEEFDALLRRAEGILDDIRWKAIDFRLREAADSFLQWVTSYRQGILLSSRAANLYRRALELAQEGDVDKALGVLKDAERELKSAMTRSNYEGDGAKAAVWDVAELAEEIKHKVSLCFGDRMHASKPTGAGSIIGGTAKREYDQAEAEVLEVLTLNDPLRKLEDIYDVKRKVGEGGFAVVYEAVRKNDGMRVALKLPKMIDPACGRLFVKEAGIWINLRHPNIVRLHRANVYPVPYMELELCERSLSEERRPMDERKALTIALQIADALEYAHRKGLIHRDIKPSNILFSGGLWKLSDWGLAKAIETVSGTSGMFTPLYSAPEQVMPRRYGGVDERTDIYLLGLILYEMLTGRKALGETMEEVIEALAGGVEPDMEAVPRSLRDILRRCLSRDKSKRPRSMREVKKGIGKILGRHIEEEYTRSCNALDGGSKILLVELVEVCLRSGATEDAERYAEMLAGEDRDFEELLEEIRWRAKHGLGADDTLISRLRGAKSKFSQKVR